MYRRSAHPRTTSLQAACPQIPQAENIGPRNDHHHEKKSNVGIELAAQSLRIIWSGFTVPSIDQGSQRLSLG